MGIEGISGGIGVNLGEVNAAKATKKTQVKRPEPQVAGKISANPSEINAARNGMDSSQLQRMKLSAQLVGNVEAPQTEKSSVQNWIDTTGIGRPLMANDPKAFTEKYLNPVYEQVKSLYETAKTKAWETVSGVTDIASGKVTDVSTLKEGESIRVSGKGTISVNAGGGMEFSHEIKRNKDTPDGKPEYVVTTDVSPLVKLKGGNVEGTANAGAKYEYKFNSPEDVARFQRIEARLSQAGGMRWGESPLPKEDAEFLQKHLSSVEIKSGGGAKYDIGFPVGKSGEIEISPEAKTQNTLKIEYQDGKPVALVRTTEISVNGSGKVGLDLNKIGVNAPSVKNNTISGEPKATVTVETKIPLDQTKTLDVAQLIADPFGAAQMDKASNTVKIVIDNDEGKVGTLREYEISDLSGSETKQIVRNLLKQDPNSPVLKGDTETAFTDVNVTVKEKVTEYEDNGINSKIDLEYKGYGVEYEVLVERRSNKSVYENEYQSGK